MNQLSSLDENFLEIARVKNIWNLKINPKVLAAAAPYIGFADKTNKRQTAIIHTANLEPFPYDWSESSYIIILMV